jgi:hypothetical protein
MNAAFAYHHSTTPDSVPALSGRTGLREPGKRKMLGGAEASRREFGLRWLGGLV